MTKLAFKSDIASTSSVAIQAIISGLHVPVCFITASQDYVLCNQLFDVVMSRFGRQLPQPGGTIAPLLGMDNVILATYLEQKTDPVLLTGLSAIDPPLLYTTPVPVGEHLYYLLEIKPTADSSFSFFHRTDEDLQYIIPTIPDCAVVSRLRDGKVLVANEAFYTMFGLEKEQAAGKTTLELGIWKDVSKRDEWLRQLYEQKILTSFETEFYTAQKETLVVVISARVIEFRQELCIMSVARDITFQRRNEMQLQNQEASLRTLLNTIPDLVWLKDKEGKYLNCNYRFQDFVGLDKEHLLGKTDYELFDRELAEFFRLNDTKAVQAGVPTRNEEWVQFATDGHKEYLETIRTPMYSKEDNELLGVLGIGRDMSARHQADLKLQKSEALFKTVFETNPDVMTLTRLRDGVYRNVNSGFYRVLKYHPEEVINFSSLDKNIWYDTAERDDLKSQLERTGVMYNKECRFLSKDNEIVYGLMSARVIDIDDEPHLLAITRPINDLKAVQEALKESEANLKMLFSSMSEVVIMHELIRDDTGEGIDYRIVNCNPSFSRVAGIPLENILGRTGCDIFTTDTPPYLDVYSKVVDTGESALIQTDTIPANKNMLVSVVRIDAVRFATISTDITDLKRTEKELLEKNKELEKYLYAASHDLRSPMVNIQGFSQRLERQLVELKGLLLTDRDNGRIGELLSADMPKSLQFILNGAAKMDSLINSLLFISRTGRQNMNIRELDMNELFRKIIESFDYEISEYGVNISVADLSPCQGDELLLNQLFSNLLSNAIKYRDAHRPLQISIRSVLKSTGVLYQVEDTGIGIAARNADKIWDVFYRVDPASGQAGEGIGLSLVKTIADKHKGKVWLESEPGSGSTFYVELPSK